MATVFFSYSHADEQLRDRIERQLSMLRREGKVEAWHDRRIGPGEEFGLEIDEHLETADIILLLVSDDFIHSDYCYEKEMKRAMERHEAGDAVVLPVILRACEWQKAPFGKLNATPPDGKAVMSHPNLDEALLEVAKAVRQVAERLNSGAARDPYLNPPERAPVRIIQGASAGAARPANSMPSTEFNQEDFKLQCFEDIARFFETSLHRLFRENSAAKGRFRRVDSGRFTVALSLNNRPTARCTVFVDATHSRGIAYLPDETSSSHSYAELLSVHRDGDSMYLRSAGLARLDLESSRSELTSEKAAKYLWELFLAFVQRK